MNEEYLHKKFLCEEHLHEKFGLYLIFFFPLFHVKNTKRFSLHFFTSRLSFFYFIVEKVKLVWLMNTKKKGNSFTLTSNKKKSFPFNLLHNKKKDSFAYFDAFRTKSWKAEFSPVLWQIIEPMFAKVWVFVRCYLIYWKNESTTLEKVPFCVHHTSHKNALSKMKDVGKLCAPVRLSPWTRLLETLFSTKNSLVTNPFLIIKENNHHYFVLLHG